MTLALSGGLALLWLLLLGLFVAVGGLVLGPPDPSERPWTYAHLAFWAGAATITGVLLAWHLVLPVNFAATLAMLLAAAIGAWKRRRTWAECARTLSWPAAAAFVGLGIWIANHALNAGSMDDYNYEFQDTRWMHDFAIVPGLANLHGRLGFNQAHHLLAALFSVGPLAGRVNHVVNGLFSMAIVGYTLAAVAELAGGGAATRSRKLRLLLIGPALAPILFGTFGPMVSTLKGDAIVTGSVVLLACLLAEIGERGPEGVAAEQRLAVVLLVAAFAAAVKLNATAFSLVLYGAVCARLAIFRRSGRIRVGAPLVAALAVSLAMAVLVPTRGVILSGYPAYPSTALAAPVDWRVSPVQAAAERSLIWSTAMAQPTFVTRSRGLASWMPWWAHWTVLLEKYSLVLPLMLGLMAMALWIASPRRCRRALAADAPWVYGVLWAACGAAAYVWLTEAPAGRFGSGYFWISAACAAVWCHERIGRLSARGVVAALVAGLVVLIPIVTWVPLSPADHPAFVALMAAAFVWLLLFVGVQRQQRRWVIALGLAVGLSEPAGRAAAALAHGRTAEVIDMAWLLPARRYTPEVPEQGVPKLTKSGLLVYDAWTVGYDTPLPNTHYFNPYLEERRPGDLRSGFRARLPPDLFGPGYSLDFLRRTDGSR